MRRILVFSIFFTLVGCESLNLKTRDELKSSDTPAETSKPMRGEAAAPAPPPPPTMDDINAEMRTLNGRVDEVENQLKQANLAHQTTKDQAAKEKITADQRVAALEEEVKKQRGEIDALTEKMNKPKPVPPADPQAIIADGDDLAAAKKHKEAIVAYQKYRDAFPKGNRYSEVTFKIGNSFQELGMKEEAKAFYEEVIAKFPKSAEAKKATKRIKSLK